MFWNSKISEGVKLLAKQMIDNPHDWIQGAFHFRNVTHRDIAIWTASGVEFIKLEGSDAFTRAEKRYLLDAIKKSVALKLILQNERDRYHDALQDVLEEAAKHATDEEPEGWLWIDIVMKAKKALGMVA